MIRNILNMRYILIYLSLVVLITLPLLSQDYYYTVKFFGKNFIFIPKETEIAIKFREDVTENEMREIARQHGLSPKTEGLEQLRYGIFTMPDGFTLDKIKEQFIESMSIAGIIQVFVDQEGFERYIDPEWITVQFADNVSESDAQAIIARLQSKVAVTHWTPGYYTITVPKDMTVFEAVRTFMVLPEVKFSEPAFYGFNDVLQDIYLNQQWHLKNTGQESGYTLGNDINAFPAWDVTFGNTDVVIVIIDTGIDQTHPDLAGNIVPRGNEDWDFSGPGVEPIDVSGHGTAVSGIAAAIMNNIGVRGVAPASRIMPLRVNLSAGMNQNRADAINYAVSKRNDFTRLVINCSWRASGDMTAIHSAIQNAVSNNIPVFFSAGNFNTNPVEYPARYPETIAVGAMAPCNEVRKSPSTCDGENWGSNYGEDLDISAPGVRIYTTDIQGSGGYNYGQSGELSDQDYTRRFNGTSSSCPMAATVAALMLSVNPNMTVSQVRTTIKVSADKVGGYNYNWNPSKPGHSQELGYGRLNANKAVRNIYVPQVYTNIATAVSVAVSGQTIYVSSGNYTLTSNITIPSGVALTLLAGANVNFNGRYIDATNGVFNIQNGSTVYVTNGYSRYYGLFTSVQSAINFASSGRTVQLLSMTYPENISFSSKSNIALKGQGQGSTTLNGSISVTNSSYITVSNLTVTNPLTLNNASNTSFTYVSATGNRLGNVYSGTQNQFGFVTATNIAPLTWALNIYGGTGDVYYSTISNADEVAIHLTNNASYNIGTNNMFCNNGYDIYAVSGGYAYAISNTYSRSLPSSIYGNVFITGMNYVCGGGGGGGMNAMSTTTGLQAVNHDMRTLDDKYLKLMRRIREDRENNTYDVAKYSQEYEELLKGYKSLLTSESDISVIKAAILRVAQIYKATGEENAFRTYTDSVLAGGKFESLTPYFRRWALWDYLSANQYRKSLEVADEVLSSVGADDDLRAEMLYEKGLVYKYFLNDPAKSGEMFGMLIDKYPSSPLSRFAEGEMEIEMFEFVQEEFSEAEILEEELSYRLESYPNPFNPVTVIRFSLPSSGMVQLRVYDTLGRVVAVLAEGVYEAGVHEATFDASRLPSGMYFTRLESGGQSMIHRMLLVK